MKALKILILILSTICLSFAYPSWIKPGLVVVYSYEGGAGTNIGTVRGSGVYGVGYKIFLVLQVDNTGIYGTTYTMLGSQFSGIFYNVEVIPLGDITTGGLFYLDPKQADRETLQKQAPPNCQVSGNPGTYILECNIRGNIKKTVINYDRKTGLITELTTMDVSFDTQGRSSTVAKQRYIRHFYISVPKVNTFPPVATISKTYRMLTNAGIGYIPSGIVNIQYITTTGNVNKYKIYISEAPIAIDVIGIPLIGPHYIHPVLLNIKTLLHIPEANFQIVLGQGNRGGISLQHIWNGTLVLQQEFDPRNGLKYYDYYPQYMGGLSAIFELVQ